MNVRSDDSNCYRGQGEVQYEMEKEEDEEGSEKEGDRMGMGVVNVSSITAYIDHSLSLLRVHCLLLLHVYTARTVHC